MRYICQICGYVYDVDDLFQIGCVGLIKAIDNFDTSLDVKLSTYGVPMVFLSRNLLRNIEKTVKSRIQRKICLAN